ncbi:YlbF family regulator [Virgibacillus salarius]|uniref:YlbF family regulator n=1 Tax=Virgibacillus salarius TaxID=447199 RepID=UPI002491432A|nr:YlbF family regulator [Virgibacillus salarius]WBX79667.1 YlbF family regulator [Virgibacillus salarius]
MIATMEYVDILDRSEQLGRMILDSDVMEAYNRSQQELDEDQHAQRLIQAFIDIKSHYEDVQRFGRYHPDYNAIMKEVRRVKREMDMNDKVASFKIAERNLQKLLDEISNYVAHSVSEQVKAPQDGATLSDSGCGCGSGGGCGCAS